MLVIVITALSLAALSSCNSANKESAAPKDTASDQTNNGSSSQEEPAKTLAMGKKGSNKKMKEVAVTKLTTTGNLTSPEATALLQVGAPGESPEVDKQPGAGKEFIMVTFTYKAKEKMVGIHPADLKLEDSDGTEYDEVSTSGHGGIFNQDPPDINAEASVTAVYEVPTGKDGLFLTYEPYGEKVLKFKIR